MIRRPSLLGFVAAVLTLAAWDPLMAQSTEPTVDTRIDSVAQAVGDRMVLTVTVEHDAGAAVDWPDTLNLGAFEVLSARVMEPQDAGGRLRSSARFTLTTFELGDLELPSFEIAVIGDDGTATVLATDAFDITIESVGLDESGEIRDIKGPLSIPLSPLLVTLWILGSLAALGVVYWLYRRWRARATPALESVPAARQRPAHVVAYEALDQLAASGIIERGKVKAFHIAVSEIIRTYLEDRYGIDALEMATHEVIEAVECVDIKATVRDALAGFLRDCDLVKFAKFQPETAASTAMIPRARALVDETKQVEAVRAAEVAA